MRFSLLVSIPKAYYFDPFKTSSYRLSQVITSFDSRWSIHTAQSLIKEGNTDLDEYRDLIEKNRDYTISLINGHYYTGYPVGASISAIPFVFLVDKAGMDVIANEGSVQLLVASFLMALTTSFIYLIASLFLRQGFALLVAFIFAFCTSAWSTGSRALWQHTPSMLMLTIALYLLLLARTKPRLVQFASIPLAFAYVSRPTNSLSVILLTVFVLVQYRRYFLYYMLWSLTIAIPFLLYNWSVYHAILSPYYTGAEGQGFSLATFSEGLAGNLFSPSRGLLIFTPIILFSIWGMVIKARQPSEDKLDFFLIGIILLHWATISIWHMWWAGHSYGPRIFSDMLPYFIYFLTPVLARVDKLKGRTRFILVSVFLSLLLVSFLIHLRGATSEEVYYWNYYPAEVDEHPARLWDWNDPQFLRGF